MSHPLSPTQPNIITLTWNAAQAGQLCKQLRFSIFSNDNPASPQLLTTANGCNSVTVVNLMRRCHVYNLSFSTSFVFPNGSTAPTTCLQSPSLAEELYVRDVPQSPRITQVEVHGTHGLTVSWQPPGDLGGCDHFNYSLYVVDLYNEDPIFSIMLNQSVASLSIPVTLRTSANYELQIIATTDAGDSNAAVYSFSTIIPQPSGGLSPGAVAGIVVGGLGGVGLLIAGAWYFRRWQRYGGYHNM